VFVEPKGEPCRNGRTDRDAVSRADSRRPKKHRVRRESSFSRGNGHFRGARARHPLENELIRLRSHERNQYHAAGVTGRHYCSGHLAISRRKKYSRSRSETVETAADDFRFIGQICCRQELCCRYFLPGLRLSSRLCSVLISESGEQKQIRTRVIKKRKQRTFLHFFQPRGPACGNLFQSSCVILTSPTDCPDYS